MSKFALSMIPGFTLRGTANFTSVPGMAFSLIAGPVNEFCLHQSR